MLRLPSIPIIFMFFSLSENKNVLIGFERNINDVVKVSGLIRNERKLPGYNTDYLIGRGNRGNGTGDAYGYIVRAVSVRLVNRRNRFPLRYNHAQKVK